MISFSLADLRPRHVRRPSAAHSRFGGEVHAPPYIKVEREKYPPAAIWLYSRPFFAAQHLSGFCMSGSHARRVVLRELFLGVVLRIGGSYFVGVIARF